jgi:hypothetical protein
MSRLPTMWSISKRALIPALTGVALSLVGGASWAVEQPGVISSAPAMPPVDGRYTLRRGVLKLGTADFSLIDLGAGCYRYSYAANPTGLASMFIGRIIEVSEFCMDGDALIPRTYSFTREDEKDENYVLRFDHDKQLARTDDGVEIAFEGAVHDRLSLQLAVQRWVIASKGEVSDATYSVTQVEPDEIKVYEFRVTARETINIGNGPIETVKVERVDPSRRSIRVWVDPAADYRIVQVEQIKDGDAQFQMQLQ